jgi:hypothetical protein
MLGSASLSEFKRAYLSLSDNFVEASIHNIAANSFLKGFNLLVCTADDQDSDYRLRNDVCKCSLKQSVGSARREDERSTSLEPIILPSALQGLGVACSRCHLEAAYDALTKATLEQFVCYSGLDAIVSFHSLYHTPSPISAHSLSSKQR